MATYFTSDTHFGHAGMLSERMGRPRSFSSPEEMDECMISSWNNRIRKDDRVFHLGDFAYGCSQKHAKSIFDRLNGHRTLIRGNHEARGDRLAWEGGIHDVLRISIQDRGMPEPAALWLSHYAHLAWPESHRGRVHLFGHSHGAIPATPRACDVGVDVWGFRPVTLAEIGELLAEAGRREAGPAVAAALAEAA
nr:metallophosphoesterase [Methylobacterium sp.]